MFEYIPDLPTIHRAFIAGIMSEGEAKREVDHVDAAISEVDSRINDLLGKPELTVALAGGVNWEVWSPGQRRAFLRLFIARVEVNDWPAGVPRKVPRFRDETDESLDERRRSIRMYAIAQRVRIVWK